MNRIDQIFADLSGRGAKGLMPFVTAGDPDLAATEALLPALERAGASVCELGIPFSDPIADGPVIQASMTRALDGGCRPGPVLEMVSRVRPKLSMGLVAMVSYSIVHRRGLKGFVSEAAEAGIDGLIFPDLPLEESAAATAAANEAGLSHSLLIAPTTPGPRAKRIAEACTGFVYLLARAGVTGEQATLPAELVQRIEALRRVTSLPIAVGFGVSTAEQVRDVVASADAAIVGSAIMRRVASAVEGGRDVVGEVEQFVTELARGLPQGTQA